MTERDRLIELIKTTPHCPYADITAAGIADHLLANGVIVPPVKVGDILYDITFGDVRELRVESISIMMYRDRINIGVNTTNYRGAFLLLEMCDFGKTVFLTREKAERALKERSEQP